MTFKYQGIIMFFFLKMLIIELTKDILTETLGDYATPRLQW